MRGTRPPPPARPTAPDASRPRRCSPRCSWVRCGLPTRVGRQGIDRPLRQGGWPVRSASPIPYTPHGQVPRAMDDGEMRKVIRQFTEAAEGAGGCGFDLLELNLAHGYLLASFLSPLSNQRTDDYGGSLANRMRFPLAVVDAVRAIWTGPLAVKLSASDWMPAGVSLDDAVTGGAALEEA